MPLPHRPHPNPDNRRQLIKELLEALQAPTRPLTKWEENFLESVTAQFDSTGTLSNRQIEVLDQIYVEKMG